MPPKQNNVLVGLRIRPLNKIENAEHNRAVFSVRGNEVVLFSQPRPVKSIARLEGWTPETLCDQALPAMGPSFTDLGATTSVFPYEPI